MTGIVPVPSGNDEILPVRGDRFAGVLMVVSCFTTESTLHDQNCQARMLRSTIGRVLVPSLDDYVFSIGRNSG
jgi:hypothetical protein